MSKYDIDTYRSPEFQREEKPGRLMKECVVCQKPMWLKPSFFDKIKTCGQASCKDSLTSDPQSMMGRALLALASHETVSHREFTRILNTICETKEQVHSLAGQMRTRGFVQNLRRLTPEARRAIERMGHGSESPRA